jgi:hydrogenase nickel incorporation protein HypB
MPASLTEHMLGDIIAENQELALHNHQHFNESGCFAVNLSSAPGAGKTSLLEKSLPFLSKESSCAVIEGDMIGELDAERLRKHGVEVFQINTGKACHLDAQMVARLLHIKNMRNVDFLFIENVGNLVCPARFPLGEHKRVVLLSVSEGDDKPLKYPAILQHADVVLLTKCDLLPYVDFDLPLAIDRIHKLNPGATCIAVSAKNGRGIEDWLHWLREEEIKVLARIHH